MARLGVRLAVVAILLAACASVQRLRPVARAPDGATRVLPILDLQGIAEQDPPPASWEHEALGTTPPASYRVMRDDSGSYLRGETTGGGSLLTYALDADPADFRYLRFRWRVVELPRGCDPRRPEGDDCGVRVLATFAYEEERASFGEKLARSFAGRRLPGSALCYAAADGVVVGSTFPNPHVKHTQMFILQTDADRIGEWRQFDRDLVEDYRRAFGRAPPRITGVAVMVDADQTRGRAIADVAGLELRSTP